MPSCPGAGPDLGPLAQYTTRLEVVVAMTLALDENMRFALPDPLNLLVVHLSAKLSQNCPDRPIADSDPIDIDMPRRQFPRWKPDV